MKKTCSKCGVLKESHEFYICGNANVCRQCQSELGKFKRFMKKLGLDHNKPHLIIDEFNKIKEELEKHKKLNKELYLIVKNAK